MYTFLILANTVPDALYGYACVCVFVHIYILNHGLRSCILKTDYPGSNSGFCYLCESRQFTLSFHASVSSIKDK